MTWTSHLLVAPVALPLLAGTLMLFVDDRRRAIRSAINAVTVAGNLAVDHAVGEGTVVEPGQSGAAACQFLLDDRPADFRRDRDPRGGERVNQRRFARARTAGDDVEARKIIQPIGVP